MLRRRSHRISTRKPGHNVLDRHLDRDPGLAHALSRFTAPVGGEVG